MPLRGERPKESKSECPAGVRKVSIFVHLCRCSLAFAMSSVRKLEVLDAGPRAYGIELVCFGSAWRSGSLSVYRASAA